MGNRICRRPYQIVATQQKNWTAVGITIIRLAAVKKLSLSCGKPVANMWCTHTLKPTKPVATTETTIGVYPKILRLEKQETIVETIAAPGRKMMYTSGCPKNQNRCWYSRTSPPSAGLKKCVPTSLSSSSSPLATITAGMAKMTIIDSTSFSQSKIGMRFRVIPGARWRRMVVARQTATPSAETSVNVIICDQTSTRCPGEYCGPESGTYAN